MLNLNLAIATYHVANAAIPQEAPDDVMDAAVGAAASALDEVRRIPAFTLRDVAAKLTLAGDLVEWDVLRDRLIKRATDELATIECNRRQAA